MLLVAIGRTFEKNYSHKKKFVKVMKELQRLVKQLKNKKRVAREKRLENSVRINSDK